MPIETFLAMPIETLIARLAEYVNGPERKMSRSQWRNFASECGDIEPVIALTLDYVTWKKLLPEIRADKAAERKLAFRAARALRKTAQELEPLSRIYKNRMPGPASGFEDIKSSPQSLEQLRAKVLEVAGARKAQVAKGDPLTRGSNKPLVGACIYIEQITGKQQCKQHYDQVAFIVEALCYALNVTNKKDGEEVDQIVDGDAVRLIVARHRAEHSSSYERLEEVVHDFITWAKSPLAVTVPRPSIATCIASGSDDVPAGLEELSCQVYAVFCDEPGRNAQAIRRRCRHEQEELGQDLEVSWQRQCLLQDVRWTLKNAQQPMDRARIGRSLIRGGHDLDFLTVDSALLRLKIELDLPIELGVPLVSESDSFRLLESRVVESIIKLGDTEADAEIVKVRDGFKSWLETQPIDWSPYAYLWAFDIFSSEVPKIILGQLTIRLGLGLDEQLIQRIFDTLHKLLRQYVDIAGVTSKMILKKLG